MATGNHHCFICGELTRSQERFILHPVSERNKKHREFYTAFVDTAFSFDSLAVTSLLYVCRKASSCYTKLDAGLSKAEALSGIIKNLKDLKGDSCSNIHSSSPLCSDNLGVGTSSFSLLGKRTPIQRTQQTAARKRLRMTSAKVGSSSNKNSS